MFDACNGSMRRVLFIDESRFTQFRADGRRRVSRRTRERYSVACIIERGRFGGGSVMVCGGIDTRGTKAPFVIIQGNLTVVRYTDQVMQSHVVPVV